MRATPEVEIDESRVWHYTDRKGLSGILGNHVIWASSADSTNDPNELLVGVETLRRLLAEAEPGLDPTIVQDVRAMIQGVTVNHRYGAYLASACWHGDSLTMWDRYASGTTGYAVVLDAAQPLFIRRQTLLTREMVQAWTGAFDPDGEKRIEEWAKYTPQHPWRWREVVYTRFGQETALQEDLTALVEVAKLRKSGHPVVRNELEVMAELAEQLRFIKQEGYQDEREKRILCMTMPGAEGPFVRQRGADQQPVNYIELGVPLSQTSDLQDGKPEAMDRLPIVGVVVGPNADLDFAATLLRAHGYENIQVSRSAISYRAAGPSVEQ